jgi:hypothetical protein
VVDERQLILDANVRAVLGRRVRQIIEDNAPHASFFVPEVAYDDARRYLPSIVVKRGVSDPAAAQALLVLEELRRTVHPVTGDVYDSHRADALWRIELRDPDDWPILATALAVDCPTGPKTRTSSVRACPRGPRTGSRSTSGPRTD